MFFSADNFALTLAQAACIALPAAGVPLWLQRFRSGLWALILPVNIAIVVVAIAVIPTTADVLTWVALLLIPPGAALAFGWAMRGARPWLAVLAAPLLLLKAGVVAIAASDAYLVFSGQLEAPNAVLVAAAPGLGLPQLQSAGFGNAGLGYGDFFAAAVVGAILAAEARPQLVAALAMLVVTLAWDQLFLVYDILPATIPPALVLLGDEAWRRRPRALRRAARGEPLPST